MNIRQTLLAGITIMFLVTGTAWAGDDSKAGYDKSGWLYRTTFIHFWQHKLDSLHHKIHDWRNRMGLVADYQPRSSYGSAIAGGVTYGVAPEIDAASGTRAIVLLTGVLLLAAERSRSRRV